MANYDIETYQDRFIAKLKTVLNTKINAINVGDLDKIAKSNEINLTELKINKLLGKGKVTKAYKVTVDSATAKAVKKIEDAKGSVKQNSAKAESEENGDSGDDK